MDIKKKVYLVAIYVLSIIIFSGCVKNESDTQYFESAKQFNKVYFETLNAMEISESIKPELLQTDTVKENIEKLSELIVVIEKNVPKERKEIFDNIKERYNDLQYLVEKYPNRDKLGRDEKNKLF